MIWLEIVDVARLCVFHYPHRSSLQRKFLSISNLRFLRELIIDVHEVSCPHRALLHQSSDPRLAQHYAVIRSFVACLHFSSSLTIAHLFAGHGFTTAGGVGVTVADMRCCDDRAMSVRRCWQLAVALHLHEASFSSEVFISWKIYPKCKLPCRPKLRQSNDVACVNTYAFEVSHNMKKIRIERIASTKKLRIALHGNTND